MKLKYLSPESIKADVVIRKNDETINMLMDSFRDFGFITPILITPCHELISGYGRLKASLKCGLEKIPCLIVDELDEDQVIAYRIIDNQIAEQSSWNYDKKKEEVAKVKMNLFKYGLPENIYEKVDIDDFFEEENKNQISIFSFIDKGCET